MAQEEKAKAYDEALNIAKETYETQPMYRAWLEKMFPELRESEDERMRKRAIAILKQQRDYWSYDGPITDSPPMPEPKLIGQAIDIAIRELERTTQTAPYKEYYGG